MPGTISRRSAIGLLGAGGLAGALVSGGSGEEAAASAPELLREGAVFGRWSIARVHSIARGALRVDVRERDGKVFALEILARDTSPIVAQPPALTKELAIYVCNGGDGSLPTVEEQGLAAMTLAHVLETRGQGGHIEGLLTHADRLVAHGDSLLRSQKA
jgi:hypothetical protein